MYILDSLSLRLRHGCETIAYPKGPPPPLPDRHGGALRLDASLCPETCAECLRVCPTEALRRTESGGVQLDLGSCLFCGACVDVCPSKAITRTGDHRLAVRSRGDLLLGARGQEELRHAEALGKELRSLLGRSLRLRQVSAGGCNACEADINVLGTIGWDLGRFGIQFVASPRHADGLMVTGPVTKNMELALKKTYDSVPAPKIVIATGACAISGGPFAGLPQVLGGVSSILPVDLFIPGCPPHPLSILEGLLRLLGRV